MGDVKIVQRRIEGLEKSTKQSPKPNNFWLGGWNAWGKTGIYSQ